MLRRVIALILALLLSLSAASAESLHCKEDRISCQVLQMVLRGDFSAMDGSTLTSRVYAAALPRLIAITEEDIAHFLTEYPTDEAALRRRLHIATGCCLWGDILIAPAPADEKLSAFRQVLLLFLQPAASRGDIEARATIRSQLTDEFIAEMAQLSGLTADFLEHLFYTDDWRDASDLPLN